MRRGGAARAAGAKADAASPLSNVRRVNITDEIPPADDLAAFAERASGRLRKARGHIALVEEITDVQLELVVLPLVICGKVDKRDAGNLEGIRIVAIGRSDVADAWRLGRQTLQRARAGSRVLCPQRRTMSRHAVGRVAAGSLGIVHDLGIEVGILQQT